MEECRIVCNSQINLKEKGNDLMENLHELERNGVRRWKPRVEGKWNESQEKEQGFTVMFTHSKRL